MKIKLEPNEIGAILKEWAFIKYKTRNINCDLILYKTFVEAELEVIMPEQDIAEQQPSSMAELLEMQKGLPKRHQEPDLMPDFAGTTSNI